MQVWGLHRASSGRPSSRPPRRLLPRGTTASAGANHPVRSPDHFCARPQWSRILAWIRTAVSDPRGPTLRWISPQRTAFQIALFVGCAPFEGRSLWPPPGCGSYFRPAHRLAPKERSLPCHHHPRRNRNPPEQPRAPPFGTSGSRSLR